MMTQLTELFDAIYVINLPERTDRKAQIIAELNRLSIATPHQKVKFFPAIKPNDKAGFPSIGARGCFLSHYEILKEARDRKLNSILFIEDDLQIPSYFSDYLPKIQQSLNSVEWSILYLGHSENLPNDEGYKLVSYDRDQGVMCTHFYAINGKIISRLIDFLENVLSRPAGHPDGGSVHYDGALSTFRYQNPDIITLLAVPNFGFQRSSRSDITPAKWYDKVQGISAITGGVRKLKNWIARR